MSLLTPTIVAFCGNSSVHSGKLSPYISTREAIATEIDPHHTRHGMADGPFYSILDYISYLAKQPMLLRPRTQREMVCCCCFLLLVCTLLHSAISL
jgi:gamma-glutamylcysteine synthetase